MTNPNNGVPVEMTVPEVLEGVGTLGIELDGFEERIAASEPDDLAQLTRRMATQFDRCAEYGQRLWHHLSLVATYLREDVAHAKSGEGDGGVLDRDAERREWADLYSATLSLLAGPRGDNGFGEEQALLELQKLNDRAPLVDAPTPEPTNVTTTPTTATS